jgi:VanZ family protein
MQWLMRCVCIGYFIFLTLLLLTTDPSRLIGMHGRLPWLLHAVLPLAHAISFLVLAVFALMARWPVPRWGIVLVLVIYGGMTEIVQGAFVPSRTAEWGDWLQNLGGIAVGAACCWGIAVLAGKYAKTRQTEEIALSPSSDEWSIWRNAARRLAVSRQSWWC